MTTINLGITFDKHFSIIKELNKEICLKLLSQYKNKTQSEFSIYEFIEENKLETSEYDMDYLSNKEIEEINSYGFDLYNLEYKSLDENIKSFENNYTNCHINIEDNELTDLGYELFEELSKIRLNETNQIIVNEEELIAQLLGYDSIWSDKMTQNEQLFRDILMNTLKIYYAGHRWNDYFDNNLKDKLIEIKNQLFKFTP